MFKITLITSNYDNSYTFNKICIVGNLNSVFLNLI